MELKISKLSCGYNNKSIVEDISFTIAHGELWCVLGPNGVGKTTFFKTILNLINPISGNVLLNNTPLQGWSRKDLAKQIAYVPQNHVPPFAFSVKEVIAMGRNPHQNGLGRLSQRDSQAIEMAIELMNIGYLYDKNYMQISGGERQLVLIARAIAQETPILVMDEPVSNLDFGNHARVIAHISNLVKVLNRTVIMTTHFPDHGFMENANVLLLQKGMRYIVGKGKDIITENIIFDLYNIDNKVVYLSDCNKTICVPL